MPLSDEQLKGALERTGVIPAGQLTAAWAKAQERQQPISEVLLADDVMSDEHLGRIVAAELKVPFVNLRQVPIPEDVLRRIPEVVAKNRHVIALKRDAQGLTVAMADPDDLETVSLVQKHTGEMVQVVYATPRELGNAVSRYRRGLREDFAGLMAAAAREYEQSPRDGATDATDETVVRIVEQLLAYGYENRASDLHLEPQRSGLVVRFRIDGILHDVVELPASVRDQVVARIKVLAKLRTDEHQAAMDGKFRFTVPEEQVDIRVSILPVTAGEKVVLRLLSSKSRQFSLEDLGLGAADLRLVKRAFGKPYGMLLATGPTGCGKTTTLYAILKLLNTRDINISTIEDPVEYEIAGLNQIQVNLNTNLTFADGLRSILRQDPDVIMVGEVRDADAAGIAVNAAMTGHLVLSTLHTNDAATALPRLLDLRVEPFLIASTVNVIVAQRLVRRICGQCRVSYQLERRELDTLVSSALAAKHFGKRDQLRLYRGKGCAGCGQTGFAGRVGIFEVLEVSAAIKQLIMEQGNAEQIKRQAVLEHMTTMLDDGLAKVVAGVTTLEEVLRATRE